MPPQDNYSANAHPEHEVDEVDLLRWPDPLPPSWTAEPAEPEQVDTLYTVTESGQPRGRIEVVPVLRTEYQLTYPAGARDRLLQVSEQASPESIQLVSEQVFEADPKCRRLVIACPEGDVSAIARAEKAGFRYVVDVDLPQETFSLMTAEPAWVLEQSRRIDVVPTD